MKIDNQSWQDLGSEQFDRTLRAAGGSLRLLSGSPTGQPASAGMGLLNGESITLSAGVTYSARAWLAASATAEIIDNGV